MQEIVGRKREMEEIKTLYNSGQPEFLVVYGRRRVGKTFLIRELFMQEFAFYHTGLSPIETEDGKLLECQLQNFASSLRQYSDTPVSKLSDWMDAFDRLRTLLETKIKEDTAKRQVVFIDELPWMDTPRSNFIAALEHFWNGWCAGQPQIMLIVCGSATSWISDHLLHNKGGLYGRLTDSIKLHPFTLREAELFYEKKGLVMDRYAQTRAYMTFGGIPYYLSFLKCGVSLDENIEQLLLTKDAKLKTELEQLFVSLFYNHDDCLKIIRFIATRKTGFTRKEIAEKTGLPYGGGLTNTLKSLEESDFIQKYTYYGKPAKEERYRLIDFFTLYVTSVLEKQSKPDTKNWQDRFSKKVMDAWYGFAFESLCWNHIDQIKSALGVPSIHSEEFSWRADANEEHGGAQIDLIIRRADRIINLCEMKFSKSEYVIDKEDDENIRNKQAVFEQLTKCRETIHPTLITTYGLSANKYSHNIQKTITLDDLFA